MDYAGIILGFLLTALVIWRVVSPLLLPVAEEQRWDESNSRFATEKERLVQVLRDLEIDYQTGKVSQDDYHHMRLASSRELAEVLERIDRVAHV